MSTAYSYVRFSTPKQLQGDSLRRQTEATRAYCHEHGLTLDESTTFRDLGVSGWDKSNIVRGMLGQFLKMVDSGKVSAGSTLIIENLDRLSRASVVDAQELFLSIINRGITIVTLMDRQVYSRETIKSEPWKMFLSIGAMIRANEESEVKSKRIRAAKQKIRSNAANGILHANYCPCWLRVENGKFFVDENKANVVRRIYNLCCAGYGYRTIAITLNRECVPTIAKKSKHDRWYLMYIKSVLSDVAVYGRSHLFEKDNYFPAIVSHEQYLQAQLRREQRKKTGGRKNNSEINSLSGVCRCGVCGHNLTKYSAGYLSKRYHYLRCSLLESGSACSLPLVRYELVETAIYDAVGDYMIDVSMQTKENDNTAIVETTAKLETANKQIAKLTDLILSSDNPSVTLQTKLKQFELDAEKLKKELLLLHAANVEKQNSVIPAWVNDAEMRTTNEWRLKFNNFLRSVVKEIVVSKDKFVIHYNNGYVTTIATGAIKKQFGKTYFYQIHAGVGDASFVNNMPFESMDI